MMVSMTGGMPRKAPTYGPERWSELAGREWSYWDLWFAAVAVADHEGSLDGLDAHLVTELETHFDGREGIESKLSHLTDLQTRLQDAGLTPADLATANVLADKSVLSRARKKFGERWIEERAKTPAMVETPRVLLIRRASR